MKVAILAGGLGTRIAEYSERMPKPMVPIGGQPILWHIMKIYSHYGFNDFVVCLGYKGYVIKEYFANLMLHTSDVTIDLQTNEVSVHRKRAEPWKVTLVDTGPNTMTGGRLSRIADHIGEERFMMTYGDGVADVDIDALLAAHDSQGRLATVTAVPSPSRFGSISIDSGDGAVRFAEKPEESDTWINGGFFVLEPMVLDYLQGDEVPFERAPLEGLARDRQLSVYRHSGFWQCMDTVRDLRKLEELWSTGTPPWRIWD